MRIKAVEYRETVSFGNYQNLSVGATAEIEDGESPLGAIGDLARWVRAEAKVRAEAREAEQQEEFRREVRADRAERDLAEIDGKIAAASERWEKAKAFLARHGVAIDDVDIPF